MKNIEYVKRALLLISLMVMALGILYGLWVFFHLAGIQIRRPIIFEDSWVLTTRPQLTAAEIWEWVTTRAGQHHIVALKLMSIFETEVLGVPPTATSLAQSFLAVLGAIAILGIISKMVTTTSLQAVVVWVCTTAILVNPWQEQNLWWEYQSPWFYINFLCLLGILFIFHASRQAGPRARHYVFSMLFPWVCIAISGQGIGLALAFFVCLLGVNRKLALSSLVGFISAYIFFYMGSSRSHTSLFAVSNISVYVEYFLQLVMGGPASYRFMAITFGMLILVVLFGAIPSKGQLRLEGLLDPSLRNAIIALSQPLLFALIFAVMVTLARARANGLHVDSADASRYVSHTLLIPISVVLIASIVYSRLRQAGPIQGGIDGFWLAMALITMGALFSWAQWPILGDSRPGWVRAWSNVERRYEFNRKVFVCFANYALAQREPRESPDCFKANHDPTVSTDYFSLKSNVPLLRYHAALVASLINKNHDHPSETLDDRSLALLQIGPAETKAGEGFNVQKSGESAMWLRGSNITSSTVIILNGTLLSGFKGSDELITTPVPPELFKKPGEYPVYLLDTETSGRSNSLIFTVK